MHVFFAGNDEDVICEINDLLPMIARVQKVGNFDQDFCQCGYTEVMYWSRWVLAGFVGRSIE